MAVTPEHRAFVEAGLGIVMATIMADGQYSEEELAWFKTAQNRHPLFRDVPPDAFNTMLHRVRGRLQSEPWRALIDEWAACVPADYRLPVLEMAAEVAVIERFLPQMMDEAETAAAIEAIKAEIGASTVKDMGRVMAELKTRHAGKLDMSKASAAVKAALS